MPLSDINPGSALTAIDSNDAPLLEFRVKRSGTITPLGVITSIAHEAPNELLKGQLAFWTNDGATTTAQMLIDQQGNVGIGTQDPEARLHVAGDARFKGPLTILQAVAGPSLSVGGPAAIAGALTVAGDVAVTGKLKAASIEGDGAGLVNVVPAGDSISSAELKQDAHSLSKVSGGEIVVEDGNVGIGVAQPARKLHLSNNTSVEMIMEQADAKVDFKRWNFIVSGGSANNPSSFSIRQLDDAGMGGNIPFTIGGAGNVGIGLQSPECRLHVSGVVKFQGPLSVSDKVGIGVSAVGSDAILDVGSRMRVRQGNSNSAGIWFSQKLRENTAFVGMVDDSRVGFYGSNIGWGLWMRTGADDAGGGALVEANGRMRIRQGAYHSAGIWFSQNKANRLGFVGMAGDDHVGLFGLKDNSGIGWGLTMRTDNGETRIAGALFAKTLSSSSKSFKIDHPLDPANKYLYHSSVESPDMMNIYNGNTITDGEGGATVVLPDYFEALNGDFRYQLTVIGKPALAAVEHEIENRAFTIKTDHPNVKVSWQVTGIRRDAAAKANRLQVEELKPEAERGMYLEPELFGAPKSKGVGFARFPETVLDPL